MDRAEIETANAAAGEDGTRWLDPEEAQTWLAVWSMMVWLPVRLDAQLRRDFGLTHPEYHALSQISMAPDRTVRLSELATVTNMTLSHLSRVVSRLEKAGWVQRTPDPDDGRYTRASLTDAGWNAVQAAAPGHVEAVRRYVFDALTPEQSRALGVAASRIVEAVNPPGKPRA
jgi:DNA-binding MarR family transcriptional regulator